MATDVTRILSAIEQGDAHAAEELLPLVYHELRRLAAAKLAHEQPGQTLQATALVHEAYLRLVGGADSQQWDHRGHFFAAAAEAMRRILTDVARQKQAQKHGGGHRRVEADPDQFFCGPPHDPAETLAIHELLDRLACQHPRKAELVKLRCFLGCTEEEAATILGIAPATAQDDWAFARAWLKREWRRGAAV